MINSISYGVVNKEMKFTDSCNVDFNVQLGAADAIDRADNAYSQPKPGGRIVQMQWIGVQLPLPLCAVSALIYSLKGASLNQAALLREQRPSTLQLALIDWLKF